MLTNRDIDSDTTLCQPCGDRVDLQNGITFDEDDRPLTYGPSHSRAVELLRPEPRRHQLLQTDSQATTQPSST